MSAVHITFIYMLFISPICRVLAKLQHKQEKGRRSVVLSFTFATLIWPWTQNGKLESVRRKYLKIRSNSQLYARVYLRKGRFPPADVNDILII